MCPNSLYPRKFESSIIFGSRNALARQNNPNQRQHHANPQDSAFRVFCSHSLRPGPPRHHSALLFCFSIRRAIAVIRCRCRIVPPGLRAFLFARDTNQRPLVIDRLDRSSALRPASIARHAIDAPRQGSQRIRTTHPRRQFPRRRIQATRTFPSGPSQPRFRPNQSANGMPAAPARATAPSPTGPIAPVIRTCIFFLLVLFAGADTRPTPCTYATRSPLSQAIVLSKLLDWM